MKINVVELKPENAQEYFELRKVSEIELPQYVGPSAERELMSGNEEYRGQILSRVTLANCFAPSPAVDLAGAQRIRGFGAWR
jgi:hypothetical protein